MYFGSRYPSGLDTVVESWMTHLQRAHHTFTLMGINAQLQYNVSSNIAYTVIDHRRYNMYISVDTYTLYTDIATVQTWLFERKYPSYIQTSQAVGFSYLDFVGVSFRRTSSSYPVIDCWTLGVHGTGYRQRSDVSNSTTSCYSYGS